MEISINSTSYISEGIDKLFTALGYLHKKVLSNVVVQMISIMLIGLLMYSSNTNVFFIGVYVILSLPILLLNGLLLWRTSSAMELQEHINVLKEKATVAKNAPKPEFTLKALKSKFSSSGIVSFAGVALSLYEMKDSCFELKDGLIALPQIFNPLAAIVLILSTVAKYIQSVSAIIFTLVFIF